MADMSWRINGGGTTRETTLILIGLEDVAVEAHLERVTSPRERMLPENTRVTSCLNTTAALC